MSQEVDARRMMQVIDQVREQLWQTPCHDIRIKFKVLSKKTIKTPEPRQCRRLGVFIVYSEYISHPFLNFFFDFFFYKFDKYTLYKLT